MELGPSSQGRGRRIQVARALASAFAAWSIVGCGEATCPEPLVLDRVRYVCACPRGEPEYPDGSIVCVYDAGPDGCERTAWYRDSDGDGVGAGESIAACEAPDGFVAIAGDCDDTRTDAHPEAAEGCNGLDDDCDGTTDEGLPSMAFYRDADSDGYGTDGPTTSACAAPPGHSAEVGDCDDGRNEAHPGAAELCNGLDDDCDSFLDETVHQSFGGDSESVRSGGRTFEAAPGQVAALASGDAYLVALNTSSGPLVIVRVREALVAESLELDSRPARSVDIATATGGGAIVTWIRDIQERPDAREVRAALIEPSPLRSARSIDVVLNRLGFDTVSVATSDDRALINYGGYLDVYDDSLSLVDRSSVSGSARISAITRATGDTFVVAYYAGPLGSVLRTATITARTSATVTMGPMLSTDEASGAVALGSSVSTAGTVTVVGSLELADGVSPDGAAWVHRLSHDASGGVSVLPASRVALDGAMEGAPLREPTASDLVTHSGGADFVVVNAAGSGAIVTWLALAHSGPADAQVVDTPAQAYGVGVARESAREGRLFWIRTDAGAPSAELWTRPIGCD